MLDFQIQLDSEIPASKQLFDQIQFAIASGQYPANQRLPSTRQLAMITGLHRNTISKVYQNLEETGLVESVAGSGIYVKDTSKNISRNHQLLRIDQEDSNQIIRESIDNLLQLGVNLNQVRELLIEEIDWRIQCNQRIFVTVPQKNINEGKVMEIELSKLINIPIKLVPLEELAELCSKINFGTIITNHYFIKSVVEVIPSDSFRIIPVDIYDYSQELEIIKKLPPQACVGIVSLSESILKIASSIVQSQMGENLLVLTAVSTEKSKLLALLRTAHTVIVGPSSHNLITRTIDEIKLDLIRVPKIICSKNFINEKSIQSLKIQLNTK